MRNRTNRRNKRKYVQTQKHKRNEEKEKVKSKIFAIRDSKAQAYLQPFFERTNETAMRAIETAIMSPDGNFNKYAEDYALYSIGEFDDNTAAIEGWIPIHLAELNDVRDRLTREHVASLEHHDQLGDMDRHKRYAQNGQLREPIEGNRRGPKPATYTNKEVPQGGE